MLRNRGMTLRVIPDELQQQLERWHKDVIDQIKQFSPAQAELFRTLDLYDSAGFPPEIVIHDILVQHSVRLERLAKLINENSLSGETR